MSKRRLAAMGIAVVVAIIYVGTLGMLPNFGEVAAPAMASALLGLWGLGTVTLGRRQ
jgi:hypothetical protein